MKKVLFITLLTAAASTASAQFVSLGGTGLGGIELGLTGGYASGLSGEIFVHKPNVAGPIGIKLSASATRPSDNINDDAVYDPVLGTGTFGDYKKNYSATESGSRTVLGLDGTYNLGEVMPGVSTLAYAGGRYGMFKANATVPTSGTASDTTTYSMNSLGVGGGVMASYALAGNISLVGDLGVDHFFNSAISVTGGNNTNDTIAVNDKNYAAQRAFVAFPNTVFKAKVGVKVNLGY